MALTSLRPSGIYAITASNMPAPLLLKRATVALNAGIAILQYRNKSATPAYNNTVIPELLKLCRNAGVPLVINDDIGLAAKYGADGVHLGQGDGSIAAAKAALPPTAIIGRTCHNSLELAREAQAEGASYVAFGAFYPSATKPNAQLAELSVLIQASQLKLPVVAIGGITALNGQRLINAGANYLAVCNEIFGPQSEDNIRTLTTLNFEMAN